MAETKRPTSAAAEEILGLYFPVLDHGFVSLNDYMGTDECIERAARVSYSYGTRKQSQTRGLLRYLRRHKHTTPSEMVELKFHCCMPIFIARQWIRHRTACLAGDARLAFDLPGAAKRGQRQHHAISISDFHRMWHQGTQHTATVDMRGRLREMQLRSCDEKTGEIIHTNVVNVWESGVKPVFRVTLENGRALKMSKDHRCLTAEGWFTLEQATHLAVGTGGGVTWRDDAPAFAVNGVPAYQDASWLRERRAEGLDVSAIAERAAASYHTIRKYLRKYGLQFSAAERAKLSGAAQRGSRRTFKKPRRFGEAWSSAVRKARSGTASNFWKGGVSTDRENIGRWTSDQARRVHERFGFCCAICAGKQRLHAHHVDPVWHAPEKAREVSNLMSLCSPCHSALHAQNLELELLSVVEKGGNLVGFWLDKVPLPASDDKRRPRTTRLVRSYSKVRKIELVGEEMTYDLEVAGPYHNFVADGFIVHNSVNEMSGRYSLVPMLFYTPDEAQLQTQSARNNQGRSGRAVESAIHAEALRRWNESRRATVDSYEWLTGQEVARELARIDLPLSTYTQWYWKIDLHNLLHFLTLRVDSHAQWEIQEFGRVMAGMLKRVAPLSYEAWIDYDVCGGHVSRMELEALRQLVGPDGTGLKSTGASLDRAALAASGLSPREADELLAKLAPTPIPDFTLDVARAVPAEHFAARFAAAVPGADQPPADAG